MSAISSGATSDRLQVDYLNLLVTQLQNQNPLEPMDTYQMSSQLSQFAQLEQLEGLNGSFQKVLAATQVSQAATLVGKEVSYYSSESDSLLSGRIDRVVFEDGQVGLIVGGQVVGFENIVSVAN